MTALMIVACICTGIVLGAWWRSAEAGADAGEWRARCGALRARCGQQEAGLARLDAEVAHLRDREEADAANLTRALGENPWLYDALFDALSEIRPGERAEYIKIRARLKGTADEAVVVVQRGEDFATRAVTVVLPNGAQAWMRTDVPDSPPWPAQ